MATFKTAICSVKSQTVQYTLLKKYTAAEIYGLRSETTNCTCKYPLFTFFGSTIGVRPTMWQAAKRGASSLPLFPPKKTANE